MEKLQVLFSFLSTSKNDFFTVLNKLDTIYCEEDWLFCLLVNNL